MHTLTNLTGIRTSLNQVTNLCRNCIAIVRRYVCNHRGTPFQLQVWKCIGGVTSGKTATYKEIACGLGYPAAVRAVASAISRNPIAYLIPCHRIVRSNGEIGGYRWNSSRKKIILNYENIQLKFPLV